MKHKTEFEELISLYVLGAQDEGELWEFQEHLKTGCRVCQKQLKNTEALLSLIAYSLEDIPLSPGVEKRVFSRIAAA